MKLAEDAVMFFVDVIVKSSATSVSATTSEPATKSEHVSVLDMSASANSAISVPPIQSVHCRSVAFLT